MELPKGTRIFIVSFFVYEILYILGVFSTRYFFVLDESHRAVSLALIIILTFLMKDARGERRSGLSWPDALLMAAGALACFYVAPTSRIVELQMASPVVEPLELVLGVVLIAVLLEGTRRVSGIALPAILVFFILYALFADSFPGLLYGRAHSFPRVIGELYLSVHGIFGEVMGLWTRILVVFILFGGFLQASGAGPFFIKLALSLTGRFRGGPGKVAVVASGLFGTVSGSAAADVATTGVVTIPMMRGIGYPRAFAGAVEAVASTGGVLMPPMMGMVAFLVAEFLDIPYLEVCYAAVIPALLYYATLFLIVDLEARKLGLRGLPRTELPSFRETIKEGWFFFVPLLVLIFYLAVLRYPPGRSALYGLLSLFVVTLFKKEVRFTRQRFLAGFETAARTALVVAIICGSVGILITSVMITGVTLRLAVLLVEASGGHLLALLALAGTASLLLGTGMPSIASYFLLAAAVAPAITELGVPPIAAHLFILYWGISHVITPPVGGALYIASSLSGVDIWRQGYQAMKLGIALFIVPFLFCYHPELLMIGSPAEILLRSILVLLAIAAVVSGLNGYLLRAMTPLERVALVASGATLMMPSWIAVSAGVGCLLLVLAWHGLVLPRAARTEAT